MNKLAKQRGFTVVELVIVIAVIAILATITIVAYTGMQGRARDTQRRSDMQTIVEALEMYRLKTGNYPAAVGTDGAGGWETSVGSTPFLSALFSGANAVVPSIPVDPLNKVNGTRSLSRSGDDFFYFYYRYGSGSSGCDGWKGNFYILGATRFESVPMGQAAPESKSFVCPSRTWEGEGAYIIGAFTNA